MASERSHEDTHEGTQVGSCPEKRQASGDFESETSLVFFQASRRMAIDLVGLGNISDC